MTTDTAPDETRRSRRIQELKSSQPVDYDDNTDDDITDDQDKDEDYESVDEDTPRKRRSKQSKSTKKAKVVGKEKTYTEMRDSFEDHYLFQALNDSDSSITELATEWVDQYEKDRDCAKKDIINLMLNAVGCFTTIEEHDVSNNESASDTAGEIQTFFKRQKVHEFYLVSKKNEYKHLKRNYLTFVTQIITICDEKGVLYKGIVPEEDGEEEGEDEEETEAEEGNVMEDLLIWFSAFSVSSVRALRFITSISLFTIQTALCKIAKKNTTSLESFKLQLQKEEAKKQTAATKKRIDAIDKNITDFTKQGDIISSFITDIVNTTFIHRFKDSDHLIRAEAMSSLGEWIEINPETFFKVTYLKYLGWVLSDANSSVRLQVVKTLVRLLKHNGSNMTGLRQFFERFKARIIEIAFYDVDHNVKINSLQLLSEINKIGYLEDEEITKITSLIFQVHDKRSLPLIAGFIQQVESDRTNEIVDSLKGSIGKQNSLPIDAAELIKIRTLIEIFQEAKSSSNEADISFANISKVLFGLPRYKYTQEGLIKYFLLDASSIKKVDKRLLKAIELNDSQSGILFELIHGALLKLKEDDDEKREKLKTVNDEPLNVEGILKYLLAILKKIETNEAQFSTFIKLFQNFPLQYFENNDEVEIFKQIHNIFIKFFKNNIITNLKSEYLILLNSLKNTTESSVLDELNTSYKSIISELTIEFRNFITDDDFEPLSPNWNQIYEDYIFKLLVLGVFQDITEFETNYEDIRNKILMTLQDSEITEEDTTKVSSIFKIFLSIVSWKTNFLFTTINSLDAEKELSVIPSLLEDLSDLINETGLLLPLRSEISIIYIDIITILSNFFNAFEDSGKTNLSNINRFKELELSSLELSQSIKDSLLYIFLSKEAIFANLSNFDIEREDDEDVNFNSLRPETEDESSKWEAEKSLAVFTTKLLSLKKLELLQDDDRLLKRVKLNEEELGELFQSIVEEKDTEGADEAFESLVPEAKKESHPDPLENVHDIPVIAMED